MSQLIVSNLSIYPIKSTAGIDLPSSQVDQYGLAFDRRFLLTDDSGQFITARTHAKLCLIRSEITPDGLCLNAPNMPMISISYQAFSDTYQPVNIWRDSVVAQQTCAAYHQWFSTYLAMPCRLHYFGAQSQRAVKNRAEQVAFADGYPLLLIGQASLDDLQQRCGTTLSMRQFRPNIVVEHSLPYAEDGWQQIRIGAVIFELVKPCSRCIFTTINPDNAERHVEQQPLATLKQYRRAESGEVMFGQNLVALNQGTISVNDSVEIISTKPVPKYLDNTTSSTVPQAVASPPVNPKAQKLSIYFHSWQKRISGNNQQTLLEQGEAAGLILPYSCRAGMCGSCKMRLVGGEVLQNATDGLSAQEQSDGYILACSCVPKTDVILNKD
jgi:uncharacterized protein